MDTQELYKRGLAVRKEIFGSEAVEKRMRAVGEFGKPLQHMINATAYGDVWERPGLARRIRSLVVLGMTAAINRPADCSRNFSRSPDPARGFFRRADDFAPARGACLRLARWPGLDADGARQAGRSAQGRRAQRWACQRAFC